MDGKLLKGLRKALRNNKYEKTESGIYVASERAGIGGVFDISVNDGPIERIPNTLVTESGNYLLDVALVGGSQLSTFYMTCYKGNVTPATTWTAANFDSNATEIDTADVDETTRQTWTPGSVSALQVDNYSSKAAFTVKPATLDLYGVAMLSTNTFGGTTGKLIAATKFSAVRSLLITDVLNLGYRFTVTLS